MRVIYRIFRLYITIISTLRNKWIMFLSGIRYGTGFRSCGCILYRKYGGKIILGNNVSINSHRIADPIGGDCKTILVTTGTGNITIGNNVGISNASLFSSNNITIEDGVCIGAGCKIYDTNFHSIYPAERLNGNTNVITAPVVIKKNAFLGGHCIILKGVTIGEGAVIAAGSVVSKHVPEYEVWGGNPAHFLKKIVQA